MNPMFEKAFEKAVRRYFGLLAGKWKLALQCVDDGLYEIPSAHFSLFIRRGSGHSPDIGVLLVAKKDRPDQPKHESLISKALGLGAIMEFYGAKLERHDLLTEEDVFLEANRLAEAISKYCTPFFLGQANDWQKVNDFVEDEIMRSGVATKQYHFPRFVRQEWIDEDGEEPDKHGDS